MKCERRGWYTCSLIFFFFKIEIENVELKENFYTYER